ncbi:MAG: DNA polymerase III subunit gamma/tau [Firmicutes bacterium]|nr:DNA polymerase III subunit gamma/tau [Bacillota bacterium]MCM1400956.1 DNA polymerase III subunit gamma/tau [Bacteroides sp.]MCM1476307.1 DNA polymerase III subunit gamma/tau [Bacteroides sp.]
MEKYLVSARKYRPSTFASVVGQKALTTTLKNAVASHRLAHSYLFCGSRGVGKTSCARIFAKTINCEHPTPDGEACNECESCREFNRGTSMNIVELDAASNNGVEDMRKLIEQVQVAPSRGQYRVFIVDEVHMLSQAAFNAFLKTLEEPPAYVVFVLATTEKQKIIPTILSRCQIYDFHRITIQDIIEHLAYVASQEGITAETAALEVIAKKADGAMRDALSIFDQVAASSAGNITYRSALDSLNVLDYEYYNRLLETFLKNDVLESWKIYKEIRDNGFDSQFFINGLGAYLRDLMVARDPATLSLIEAGNDARQAMATMAAKCSPDFLYRAMCLCSDADLNFRNASNKQFLIELTLAKICQPLSPSRSNGSNGEGRLQPIAANSTPAESTPTAATKPAAASAKPTPSAQQSIASAAPSPRPYTTGLKTSGTQSSGHQGMRAPSGLKIPHISINPSVPTAGENAVASTPGGTMRENPFSDDALIAAWNSYISTHPHAHILINTMRAAAPVRTSPTRFTITVQNQIQLELMENNRAEIMGYVRNSLANDVVDYDVNINTSSSPRHTLTDPELLEKMKAEAPVLSRLIDDFKLHLA